MSVWRSLTKPKAETWVNGKKYCLCVTCTYYYGRYYPEIYYQKKTG
jgi:hypothetical protein